MRKILISSLGSGSKDRTYKSTNYKIEDKIYKDKEYISSALEEHFNMDKIYYIGTIGSMWENIYKDSCYKYNVDYDEDYYNELFMTSEGFRELSIEEGKNKSFDILNLSKFEGIFKGKVKPILVKFGLDNKEMFENFNSILKIIDDLETGDRLYLDITHSFRSNAFWMFLVMNYVNDMIDKDIKIEYISYGMFEAKTKNEDGLEVTPVINLNIFFQITKWIKGAYTFKNFGNSDLIVELLEEEKLKPKLKEFSNSISINYISSIKKNIKTLKNNYTLIENLEGPAKLIIPKVIEEFLENFKGINEDYEYFLALAKWHNREKRYAMVFTNLQEALKSYVIETLDLNKGERYDELNKEFGYIMNKFFYKVFKNREKNPKENIPDKRIVSTVIGKELKNFIETYEFCRIVRNNIAHSGDSRGTAGNDIKLISNKIEICERIFKNKKFLEECINTFDIKINY